MICPCRGASSWLADSLFPPSHPASEPAKTSVTAQQPAAAKQPEDRPHTISLCSALAGADPSQHSLALSLRRCPPRTPFLPTQSLPGQVTSVPTGPTSLASQASLTPSSSIHRAVQIQTQGVPSSLLHRRSWLSCLTAAKNPARRKAGEPTEGRRSMVLEHGVRLSLKYFGGCHWLCGGPSLTECVPGSLLRFSGRTLTLSGIIPYPCRRSGKDHDASSPAILRLPLPSPSPPFEPVRLSSR